MALSEAAPPAARIRTDWVAVAENLGPQFAARAAAHDADDAFVATNYAELREQKVFSAGVPAELGGGGASHAELCEMLRTVAHYCSSTALALAMHTHQVAIPAWRWRHDDRAVEPLLRRIAAEELILVTSGGSDWLAGSGRADKVEGGYRVTGRKVFASGSPSGDLFMTMAVHDDPAAGPTVLHFAIPFTAAGVKVQDNWRTLGMRGTGSNDVVLDGVFVPETAIGVRRPAGRWSRPWHVVVMMALPLINSVYVGVAEAAAALALREAKARKRHDDATQEAVGIMETELAAARMALRHMVAAAAGAGGDETTNEILMGRTLLAEAALRTVEAAMGVVAGAGFFRGLGLERLFRDVQAARYHPLRRHAQRRYTGRLALGLDLDD